MTYSTTAKMVSWGGSTALRFPKEALSLLDLSANDTVKLEIMDEKMFISKKRKTLAERFETFEGEYHYPVEGKDWIQMERVGGELL